MEYKVSEADGFVNISVVFGETQSQVVVGLTTVPDTASGWQNQKSITVDLLSITKQGVVMQEMLYVI